MHNNIDYSTFKAISNSALGMLKISPKVFIKYFNQELEEEDKKYFKEGSAIHCYILEPEVFEKQYKFLNYEMPNSPNKKKFVESYLKLKGKGDNRLIEAYKQNYSIKLNDEEVLKRAKALKREVSSYLKYLDFESKGVIVLHKDYENYLRKIKNKLQAHHKANELLFRKANDFEDIETFNEFPIFWKKKVDGREYDMKALLDRFIINRVTKTIQLVDLKTTRKIHGFEESVNSFGYDRQLSFYTIAIMELFKQQYPKESIEDFDIEHFIVAIDKEKEPECRVFKISKERIITATKEISDLLNRAHWHFSNNKWDLTKEQYTDGYEII